MKTFSERIAEQRSLETRETYEDVIQMWKSGGSSEYAGPTNPYRQNIWVFSCVNAIAKNVAGVPFRLFPGKSSVALKDDHPLMQTLLHPNPFMSSQELLHATETYLQLGGNALWIPTFGPRGDLLEIWVFGRHQIEPKYDKQGGVLWKVKWFDHEEIFPHDEVIHFRYFNPNHPILGMSPLEAARSTLLQDFYANKYNEAFFMNNADPGTVLIAANKLSKPERDEMREAWEARHQGFGKARRTALLWGGVDIKELKVANRRDMQFIEQKRMNREEILAIFRVPPIEVMLVDLASSRVESQKAQRTLFGEEVLWPELSYFQNRLNAALQRWGLDVRWEWDISDVAILQESMSEKIKQAEALEKMGLPLNQIIDALELPFKKVEWGDDYFIPSNMAPARNLLDAQPITTTQPDEKPKPSDTEDDEDDKPEDDKEESDEKALSGSSNDKLLPPPPDKALVSKLSRALYTMRNSALRSQFDEDLWNAEISKLLEKCGYSEVSSATILKAIRSEALAVEKEESGADWQRKVKVLFARMKRRVPELAKELQALK